MRKLINDMDSSWMYWEGQNQICSWIILDVQNSSLDPLIYEMSFLDYFWNTLYNSNLINIWDTICVGLYLMNKNKIS